jgi:hypothetical protein
MNWNPNQHDPYSPPHGAFQPPGGSNPYGQNPYGHGPYGQNPYGYQQPPRSSGSLWWLWLLLGVGGGLVVLCGGCCIGLIFVGTNVEEQELKERLADNPVIAEHIGKIVSLETQVAKSFAEDDMNTFYYRIVGTLGEGELVVKEEGGLNFDEPTPIEWAKLRLDSGEEFDVLP